MKKNGLVGLGRSLVSLGRAEAPDEGRGECGEILTCVLQSPVFTDGSWWFQVGPVMKQHLHGWGLYLGRTIGNDIQKILHRV